MSCWTNRNKYNVSFICMILLTMLLLITKVFIGYKENSLSLVADSFHLMLDLPALVVGYLALTFAKDEDNKDEFTFGRVRAEIIGAMVNTIFLIAICFSLAIESFKRLFVPSEIENPQPVLIIGILGLMVNVIGLALFRCCNSDKEDQKNGTPEHVKFTFRVDSNGSSRLCQSAEASPYISNRTKVTTPPDKLNIHGVFLHILQHAFIASIVITSALIVMFAEGRWTLYVDPCLSLVLVCVILKSLYPLLKECLVTFMQSVPADLQLQKMEERLIKHVPEVVKVHELHIWQLAGDQVVGSAHVVFQSYRMYNQETVDSIREFFLKEGISTFTMQPEFSDYVNFGTNTAQIVEEDACLLKCEGNKCANKRCCETPSKILAKLQQQL